MRYGPNSSSEKLTTLVADIVCQSLQIEETPIPRKIARLYLVSDILHNSVSAPRDGPVTCANLNRHRQWQTFGDIARCLRVDCLRPLPTLPLSIRDSWNWWGLLPRMSSKSRSTQFSQFGKDGALASLVWGPRTDNSHRMVFTADFHKILRDLLHGQATLESLAAAAAPEPEPQQDNESRPKSAGFKSSFKRITSVPSPHVTVTINSTLFSEPKPPQDIVSSDAIVDLDGEEMESDGSGGLHTGDVDGEDVDGEDFDGDTINAEDDLDGEAIDP